jgi:hypothetical protein
VITSRARDRIFRRGLILGWTLAEIILLIVFALLFAIAALTLKLGDLPKLKLDLQHLADSLRDTQQQLTELRRENEFRRSLLSEPEQIDDIFHELWLVADENASMKEELSRLSEDKKSYEGLNSLIERQTSAGQDASTQLQQLIQKAKEAAEAQKLLEQYGLKFADLPRILERLKELSAQLANNKGQVKNLEASLAKTRGGGNDKPPCWADADGHPDYIFNVTLASGGIMVHDNKLPNRIDEEKSLPIGEVSFDRVLSDDDFIDQTEPLFSWGDGRDVKCRFYVRVFDNTQSSEKVLYKQLLDAVNRYFYHQAIIK